jgi:HSP20 family molecular chaperone IbpA
VRAKQLQAALQRKLVRAWQGVSADWRKIMNPRRGVLTRFNHAATHNVPASSEWAQLASEVWETAQSVVIQIELPGMRQEDVDVSVRQGRLIIRGEKLAAPEVTPRLYHLMERTFGSFERSVDLPPDLDVPKAEISFQDGIMTAIVPKMKDTPPPPPPRRRRR